MCGLRECNTHDTNTRLNEPVLGYSAFHGVAPLPDSTNLSTHALRALRYVHARKISLWRLKFLFACTRLDSFHPLNIYYMTLSPKQDV